MHQTDKSRGAVGFQVGDVKHQFSHHSGTLRSTEDRKFILKHVAVVLGTQRLSR
jgi:hypothetical protein